MFLLRIAKREFQFYVEGVRRDLGLARRATVPHVHKRRHLRSVQARFGLRTFIETGTYHGDMLAAMAPHFSACHSIELSRELYEAARRRFSRVPHVSVYHGDSGGVLSEVLARCTGPALCWLDAHYSAGITARGEIDTPVERELALILEQSHEPHVILIDDARLFVGSGGYPTLATVRDAVARARPHYEVGVRDDIIWLLPPGQA